MSEIVDYPLKGELQFQCARFARYRLRGNRSCLKRRHAVRVKAMKILRSVNRRGSTVGSAGFFTVLRPNGWFAATRLPDSFHYLNDRYKRAAELAVSERRAINHADSAELTGPSNVENTRWVQSGLVVLTAAAAASALLWLSMDWPSLW